MNRYDGTTPMSLFLQVNSISIPEMVAACEHIRAEHKDPSKEDYIFNLSLNEIGTASGALYTSVLDALLPYLPGGAKQAFDNVFVGSMVLPWTGPGNAYREGIQDGQFRWDNLVAQKKLWQAFDLRYGGQLPWYFHYINYEGVLSYWDEWGVRSAQEAFLIQSVRDSFDIRGDESILWSPAIWRDNALSLTEVNAVSAVFDNVDAWAGAYGHTKSINFLHLQDVLGRGWVGNDMSDVAQWYNQLKGAHTFASLAVNAEIFTPDYKPLSDADYRARMNFYDANGIPVRSSWELRYYHRHHVDV